MVEQLITKEKKLNVNLKIHQRKRNLSMKIKEQEVEITQEVHGT